MVELAGVSAVDSPGLTGIEESGENHFRFPFAARLSHGVSRRQSCP